MELYNFMYLHNYIHISLHAESKISTLNIITFQTTISRYLTYIVHIMGNMVVFTYFAGLVFWCLVDFNFVEA